MEYLKKLLGKRDKRKVSSDPLTPEEKLTLNLKPFQSYLYRAQKIVTWDSVPESVSALAVVNLIFGLLSYIGWKFYGLFFSIIFLFTAHEAWVEHIWPEIRVKSSKREPIPDLAPQEGVLTVPEISRYATSVRAAVSGQYSRLRYLRVTQPPVYCAVVSAGCLFAAGIGTVFSGLALIYLTVMSVMIGPGIVKHLLPLEWKTLIYSWLVAISALLIPPDLSTPSTEDSSLADLLIPSHEDSEPDHLDSLTLPTIPQAMNESFSDTDEEANVLKFKSGHFKTGRSSSTDEDSFLVKDLEFPDIEPNQGGIKDAVAGVLYKTFPKAFTSVRHRHTAVPQDDSDSDFEIIDNETS